MSILVLLIILVLLGAAAYGVSRATFIARGVKILIYVVIGIVAALLVLNAIVPSTMNKLRDEPVPRLD